MQARNGERCGRAVRDPQALARIQNLELLVICRRRIHQRPAPRAGTISPDFAEHRGHEPGDDLRRVDWRLFGRTTALRQTVRGRLERQLRRRAYVPKSMRHGAARAPGDRRPRISKSTTGGSWRRCYFA
jgi:hypothetical protein